MRKAQLVKYTRRWADGREEEVYQARDAETGGALDQEVAEGGPLGFLAAVDRLRRRLAGRGYHLPSG
jgi:hypothetical protein